MAKTPQYKPDPIVTLPEPPAKKASDYLGAYKGWAYAAIDTIATAFSGVDIKLFSKKKIGKEYEIEEIHEHEALSLLYYSNDFMTFDMLKRIYCVYMYLLGEATWTFVRSGGKIEQIWPLRPDWVTIKPSKDSYIDHYEYSPGGGYDKVRIEPEDLLFFKDYSPTNPYRGYGYVRAGAMQLDIDEFSDEWNRNFFYNSALPYLFLMSDKNLGEENAKRILESFHSKFGGRRNAHKIAILDGGGWDVKEMGGKMREMDYLESKKYIRDEVLAVFGVSKANLGVVEDVNRANQEATDARFLKNVIAPLCTQFCGFLNEFYLPNFDTSGALFFNFDDPSPENVESKLALYENGLKYGWLTRNEIRLEEGLEPLEGGDSIYVAPAPFQGSTDEEQPKSIELRGKTPEPKLKLGAPIPPKRTHDVRKDAIKGRLKGNLVKLITQLMNDSNKKPSEAEYKEMVWKQMVAKTNVWESLMIKEIQELANDQAREVIENIKTNRKDFDYKQKKSARQYLFNSRSENVKWHKVLSVFIGGVIQKQGEDTLYDYGLAQIFDMSGEEIEKFLEDIGYAFVKEVNATTRSKLIETIGEGIRVGEGIDDMVERVQDVYGELTTSRANMIARTEVLRAANFATEQAYKQSGVVIAKEWLTAADERTCPFCRDMDGKVVDVDKTFWDEGQTMRAEDADGKTRKLNFKIANVSAPPLHPQCRCTLVPVTINTRNARAQEKRIDEIYDSVMKRLDERELEELKREQEKAQAAVKSAETKKKLLEDAAKERATVIKEEAKKKAKKEAEREKKKLTGEVRELRDKLKEAVDERPKEES